MSVVARLRPRADPTGAAGECIVAPVRARLASIKLPLALLAAFGLGVSVGGSRADARDEWTSPHALVAQLARVLVLVENHYVDPVPREKLLSGALGGMVAALDPHSSYLDRADWAELESETKGEFGGVGVEVEVKSDRLVVIAPIDGSPAYRAGIKSGDRIVAIDGLDARGTPFDKLVKRMRGAPGSKVRVTLLREGAPKPIELELVREIIHVASVSGTLLVGDVAYVHIKQFQENTHGELMATLARLRTEAKGRAITGVLLDVRSNPGGLVDEAEAVADELMDQGTIYTLRRRGKTVEQAQARAGGALASVPVVALVNEWSASAAELLVGALQDYDRALVVGVPSFGKGSVQTILPLPGATGLKITTARYFTPKGHAIQADGIHPDVVVGGPVKTTRERDLPEHLAPEGPNGGAASAESRAPRETLDGGAPDAPPVTRDVPFDPSTSQDVVLRVGWERLRQRMSKTR